MENLAANLPDSLLDSRRGNHHVNQLDNQLDNPRCSQHRNLLDNHPDNQPDSQLQDHRFSLRISHLLYPLVNHHYVPVLCPLINLVDNLPFSQLVGPVLNRQVNPVSNRLVIQRVNQHQPLQGNPVLSQLDNPLDNPQSSH